MTVITDLLDTCFTRHRNRLALRQDEDYDEQVEEELEEEVRGVPNGSVVMQHHRMRTMTSPWVR